MSENTIIELINQYGYLGIAFLIAIENIFPPIPSELVLIFTGYLTVTSKMTIWGSVLAATAGALIGAIALYGVGRLLSVKQIEKLVSGRFGKLMRLKPAELKAARYFNNHGGKAILLGRCIPVVRSLISIPAGMTGFPLAGSVTNDHWNRCLEYHSDHHWSFCRSCLDQILGIVDEWLMVIFSCRCCDRGLLFVLQILKKKSDS